ncbi:MAG: hypothetical protein ACK4QP_16285 [Pseudorhizobium sp.]
MVPLPFGVVLANGMADLMMVLDKEIEAAVPQFAQMARAAGPLLIMVAQRLSVEVIRNHLVELAHAHLMPGSPR